MGEEIMIEIGLGNLAIMMVICAMPFIVSAAVNVYFLFVESKYIKAFKRIVEEPDKSSEIALDMIPGDHNDRT